MKKILLDKISLLFLITIYAAQGHTSDTLEQVKESFARSTARLDEDDQARRELYDRQKREFHSEIQIREKQKLLEEQRLSYLERGFDIFFGIYGKHDLEAAKTNFIESLKVPVPFTNDYAIGLQALGHIALIKRDILWKGFVEYCEKYFMGENKCEPALYYLFALRNHLDLANASHYEEAFKWFKMAADQGHVRAQFKTAVYYLNGLGTMQDLKSGIHYLKLARENLVPEASVVLDKIADGSYFAALIEEAEQVSLQQQFAALIITRDKLLSENTYKLNNDIQLLRYIKMYQERAFLPFYLARIEPSYAQKPLRPRSFSTPPRPGSFFMAYEQPLGPLFGPPCTEEWVQSIHEEIRVLEEMANQEPIETVQRQKKEKASLENRLKENNQALESLEKRRAPKFRSNEVYRKRTVSGTPKFRGPHNSTPHS